MLSLQSNRFYFCKQYDAGGPLVVQGDDGVWTQIGVASFESDLGCFRGYPSVYTRVTEYLQWIQSVTGLQL